MHHAEPDELGVLEPGNQPQHALLLAPLQLRLEAHQAVVIAGQVVLPQLHGCVRRAARARIDEADRLHRPEPQRVQAAVRHDLDRQAPFEEDGLVEVVDRRRLRVHHRVQEPLVLVAGHRTVQVIAFPVVYSTGRPSRSS